MTKNIYLLLELQGQTLSDQSREILGEALRLADKSMITALIPQATEEVIADLPVNRVYYGGKDFPILAEAWANSTAKLDPADLVIATMSVNGRDFAAAYAADTGITYISAVCGIKIVKEGVQIKRLTYGGLAQEEALMQTPLVLGLAPGVWGICPPANGQPALSILPEPPIEYPTKIEIERVYTADWQEMEINEGDIVVAGGMGMGNTESFRELYQLGSALQAPVGGSRVAEDKGWIDHSQMIGATGQTIVPKLYIACGISGAVQHTIGIQGSRYIISINTDATSAMMSGSDLAVQCDAPETIKVLSELLQNYSPVKEG